MVQMNNVRKVYESSNTVALDGVSLTINDGEFVFSLSARPVRERPR